MHTIKRIYKNQTKNNGDIQFEWRLLDAKEDKQECLELAENNFLALQLMLLMNDRFANVFNVIKEQLEEQKNERENVKKNNRYSQIQYNFSILNDIRLALKQAERKINMEDVDLYVWEKLTRMNAAVLLSNYYFLISQKYERYDLLKEEFVYEDGMIVGTQKVNRYTKEEFEKDIFYLAEYIGTMSCILSALILVRRCFEYILKNENVNLYNEVEKLKSALKSAFPKVNLENGEEIERVIFFAKIILYLRDKCFVRNRNYKKRLQEIVYELDELTYQEFIELLYDDFDEEQWYQDLLEVMIYDKKENTHFLENTKLKLKHKIEEKDMSKVYDYFKFYSFESIDGRLLPHNVRLGFISQINDPEVREILREHNEEWKGYMLNKLRTIIQSKKWESPEKLEYDLSSSGWHMKEDWFNKSETMRRYLIDNFNPFIYKADRTLVQYKLSDIIMEDYDMEYNKIQKFLLYHK